MPRKMAEYHEPLNHVVQDYITYLRCHRHENDIFADIVESLNKWSLECKWKQKDALIAIIFVSFSYSSSFDIIKGLKLLLFKQSLLPALSLDLPTLIQNAIEVGMRGFE